MPAVDAVRDPCGGVRPYFAHKTRTAVLERNPE